MIIYTDFELGSLDGEPITAWQVWFITMRGYHKSLTEALLDAAAIGQPPETIQAVPVAIAGDKWEPR